MAEEKKEEGVAPRTEAEILSHFGLVEKEYR